MDFKISEGEVAALGTLNSLYNAVGGLVGWSKRAVAHFPK